MNNDRSGMSLLELMIGVAILCILSLGFSSIMSSAVGVQNYVFSNGTGKTTELNSGRDAFLAINEELKSVISRTIIVDASGHSVQYSRQVYDQSTGTVITQTGQISVNAGNVVIQHGPFPQAGSTWVFDSSKSYGKGAIQALDFTLQANFDNVSGDAAAIQLNSRKRVTFNLLVDVPRPAGSPGINWQMQLTNEVVTLNV